MAQESFDIGQSSEQSQASRSRYQPQLSLPSLQQDSVITQSPRQNSQLSSPPVEYSPEQTNAVVNLGGYRMYTGGGINPSNSNNGQTPPSNTASAAATLNPCFPPHLQQAPPRVHFRDTTGRQQYHQPSEFARVRAQPPLARSFSSKAFNLSDSLFYSSLPCPSSPQHEFIYHQRDSLLDKGIQCEPEVEVTQRVQAHPNPLLSALLAAANATVNYPSGSSEFDHAIRRKPPCRAGALPHWSDSDVNAYDSLDTLNTARQNSIGMVSGSKAYPSASVVAAAATAAAMALAAVQSTSREPAKKPLDQPLGVSISRASRPFNGLTPEEATMRSLTGQFADTSLHSGFSSNVDRRKSVNFDATSVLKPDIYGTVGADTAHFTSQVPSTTALLDKNNQRINIASNYFHEVPGGQLRFSLSEEANTMQQPHLRDASTAGGQEHCLPVSSDGPIGSIIPQLQLPSKFNSIQFNLLSSKPYPGPSQTNRSIIQSQSSANESPPLRHQIHCHVDDGKGACESSHCGGGLLVVHIIAGSGLQTTQMLLRDLYCVLEVDSIRKARSMIRTSKDYFEWEEVFEMEIEDSRFLSILIYQWDSRTRHRLYFYGGIDLITLIKHLITLSNREQMDREKAEDKCQPLISPLIAQSGMRFEKIALQLEPRGVLYLQMGFLPLFSLYTRRNLSAIYDTSFFGVSLNELIYRDRMLSSLGGTHDSVVPLLIRKCVEEVDKRGTEVVGIYRLSGSVWMKLHVRDLFTRTAEKITQGLAKRNEKTIREALASLDLSADIIPDIHAITATLEDFFRELPEPLFTDALYPMVYEATQVASSGGSHMGTKLILNILDCLPTSNQEVLLYLLDHLKRITSKSMVNKMNSHNLAVCLASCLLHPSPAAAREIDAGLLNPNKMVSVLECILDIWP